MNIKSSHLEPRERRHIKGFTMKLRYIKTFTMKGRYIKGDRTQQRKV